MSPNQQTGQLIIWAPTLVKLSPGSLNSPVSTATASPTSPLVNNNNNPSTFAAVGGSNNATSPTANQANGTTDTSHPAALKLTRRRTMSMYEEHAQVMAA
ncbi:hypothetical protein HK098_006235, partial [Nowakowskiella sp. JEL0407]